MQSKKRPKTAKVLLTNLAIQGFTSAAQIPFRLRLGERLLELGRRMTLALLKATGKGENVLSFPVVGNKRRRSRFGRFLVEDFASYMLITVISTTCSDGFCVLSVSDCLAKRVVRIIWMWNRFPSN
jgi:hypothetical protein